MKSSDDLHFHLKKLNSEKAISEKFTLQELYILFSIPPLIGANGKSYFFFKRPHSKPQTQEQGHNQKFSTMKKLNLNQNYAFLIKHKKSQVFY